MGVFVFSLFLGSQIAEPTLAENREAFRYVILVASGIVSVVGVLVWIFMRLDPKQEKDIVLEQISIPQIKQVLRLPSVWLLMIIILCAYVGYKITDVFSLYAQDVMDYDQVASAQVGMVLLFIRPLIGVLIGILADRTQTTFWLLVSFVISFSAPCFLPAGSFLHLPPCYFSFPSQ